MTEPCTLQKLSPRVYAFTPNQTTDRPSLGAIVGSTSTLLVEAGNSNAHIRLFLDALADAGVRPPRYAALTHWHWDHIFGAEALGGIPIFAHTETTRNVQIQAGYDWSDEALDQRVIDGLEIDFCRTMIKAELPDRSSLKLVVPDISFTDSVTIDLGDLTCEITQVGGDHSADSSIVYVPQERVLFLGDCHYPNIHVPESFYTPDVIFPLMDRLLAYEAETYVEGHGEGVMSRAEMIQLAADLRASHQAVKTTNGDRDAALQSLSPHYADLEAVDWLVDAFIAGKKRTVSPSNTG